MKAAVFASVENMQMRELPEPVPGPEEVLIKVSACGVCGTDVHIYHGHVTEDIRPPVLSGSRPRDT